MNAVLYFFTKYLFLPLGIAAAMYVLVHFQLLLLHKLIDMGLTHRKRTRINIIAFFSTFFAVIALILVRDYLGGNIG